MYYRLIEIKKKKKIYKQNKKLINIYGWIKSKRYSKIGILFLDINDGSSVKPTQIIIKKKILKKNKIDLINLNNGCSIIIKGKIKKNKNNDKNEIHAKKIKIIGNIKNSYKYPISPKYHSAKYLRTISHLRPRTNLISSISRIRNTLIYNLHKFFQKKNFYLIPTPIITSIDTEGNSKMFEICQKNNHFFNKNPFLTVSGQLNLETYACALSKVYNLGPVFRAENSNTKKHLAEFWMLETEIVLLKKKKIIKLIKKMLSYCIEKIIKKNYQDLNFLIKYNKKNHINLLNKIIEKKIITVSYTDVIKILKKKEQQFNKKIIWGIDISTEQEKYLTKKYFKSSIIIIDYPKKIKPFYMKRNKDNITVSSLDLLLLNVGEIIGGSEREYNINKLNQNMKEKKINKKQYWWYRDLRKFGTIPHSGFGLGIERLLMYITNIQNIKDIIPYPRYPNYLNF